MSIIKIRDFVSLIQDLAGFLKQKKSYWLAPLIFLLLLLGTLFFVLEGSVIAPVIYTIF